MLETKQASITIEGRTFAQAMRDLEAAYIGHVLTQARFNQTKAAKLAGMSYNAFRERVSRLDLTVAAA